MFCFLLDVKTIKGTIVEKRINEIASKGFISKQVYALKSTSESLCRNAHMYSPAQMKKLKTILRNYNHFCGYAYNEQSEKDKTSFFLYPASEETASLQG